MYDDHIKKQHQQEQQDGHRLIWKEDFNSTKRMPRVFPAMQLKTAAAWPQSHSQRQHRRRRLSHAIKLILYIDTPKRTRKTATATTITTAAKVAV